MRFTVEAYPIEQARCLSRVLKGAFTHCVRDTGPLNSWTDSIPYQGSEAECEAWAEQRNLQWAQQLMTQGTAAEGL